MAVPFLAGAAPAAFSALTSLFNSANQSRTARQNTERTIQAQRELAEYSYTKDLEMWNKANEYNNPQSQMQRLKSAGLNPNMAYGSGSVAGNTSTQTPKYQAYSPQYRNQAVQIPDLTNVLSNFMDLKVKQAQINQTNEATKGQSIENFYKGSLLKNQDRKGFLSNLQLSTLLNQGSGMDQIDTLAKDSPYMKQFQASTQQKINDATLKHLEGNLLRQGVSKSDNMLLRMAVQSGLFNIDQLKNMFK